MNRPDIDIDIDIDLDTDVVFGRGRLRMVTGSHVEVFREESRAGERRHYSKRFLVTNAGDFRPWMERERRILTRLLGLGIAPAPRVEPFDGGADGRPELLRTYDAGVTVDHWATLVPVQRDGTPHRHVFEDCAHWWALAGHCLKRLDALDGLGIVHLDLKADNVCIPFSPPDFDPAVPGAMVTMCFEQLALIDFAFSLTPEETLSEPLPLAHQTEYDYQSPRLLKALEAGREGDLTPTQQLDWRCDMFSLAAMLRRYLPGPETPPQRSWTRWHLEQAGILIRKLLEAHDAEAPAQRPHRALIALTKEALADAGVSASLKRGWTLADLGALPPSELATPLTRIAMPAATSLPPPEPESVVQFHLPTAPAAAQAQAQTPAPAPAPAAAPARAPAPRAAWATALIAVAAVGAPLLVAGWWAMQSRPFGERAAVATLNAPADAVSAAPLLPTPQPAPAQEQQLEQEQALQPPVAAVQPAPEPAETEAFAKQPMAQTELPTAPAVGPTADGTVPPSQLAFAPPPTPVAAAPSKVATRGRMVTKSQVRPVATADRSAIDEAERRRALEWLSRRGPSPQPGMKPPPAPAADRSSTDQSAIDQAERERAFEWLTSRGPSPRPGMKLPPAPEPDPAQ